MSAAPTAAGPVCWVDLAWDRTNASDRVSRYGAYLRGHAEEFESWHGEDQDGITTDPGEVAAAAFRVACGPIMSPGYVRWHPRILDHQVGHGENPDPGRLVLKVCLATSLPMWLGSPWWSWTTYLGRDWSEPEDAKHAALARLELRGPLQVATLPPTTARQAGRAEPGRRQGSGPGVGCRDQPDRGAGAGQAGGR